MSKRSDALRLADLPGYDCGQATVDELLDSPHWTRATEQLLRTTAPYRSSSLDQLAVLDVGSGYGGKSLALAAKCRSVVGLESSSARLSAAEEMKDRRGLCNVEFRLQSVEQLDEVAAFDLAVLDNVLEHLPDQPLALRNIVRALRPGGVLYILVPNKLWPIEHHYHLPFLGYLPVPAANAYLRASGRGHDYTDASYAPTYFGLNRLLRRFPELSFQYVPPADVSLALSGSRRLYRWGVAAIRRWPFLWAISKSLLVVATKER